MSVAFEEECCNCKHRYKDGEILPEKCINCGMELDDNNVETIYYCEHCGKEFEMFEQSQTHDCGGHNDRTSNS